MTKKERKKPAAKKRKKVRSAKDKRPIRLKSKARGKTKMAATKKRAKPKPKAKPQGVIASVESVLHMVADTIRDAGRLERQQLPEGRSRAVEE